MPIVISYNDLGLLGGLAVQAGQAQGEIRDKEYFRQRQMRDESMLLQDSLNQPQGMPAAQFGAQPTQRPGGTAGTVMDVANQSQARIVQKTPVAPVGGSVNLGEQELVKNREEQQTKIEDKRKSVRQHMEETDQLVNSGVLNQIQGEKIVNDYLINSFAFKPGDLESGDKNAKPTSAAEHVGYAAASMGNWGALEQSFKENKANQYSTHKSPSAQELQTMAGVQKYFRSIKTSELVKIWASHKYPYNISKIVDAEMKRRTPIGNQHGSETMNIFSNQSTSNSSSSEVGSLNNVQLNNLM